MSLTKIGSIHVGYQEPSISGWFLNFSQDRVMTVSFEAIIVFFKLWNLKETKYSLKIGLGLPRLLIMMFDCDQSEASES